MLYSAINFTYDKLVLTLRHIVEYIFRDFFPEMNDLGEIFPEYGQGIGMDE